MANTEHTCPNGHPFPMPYAVNCRECSALVVVEPVSVGMELDRQLRGAVSEHKAEAYRLRAIMAEAVKQDPVTCKKWIRDALTAGGGQ